jgi:FAD:protein FMN transferase
MMTTGSHHVEDVMGMAVSLDVRDDIEPGAISATVAWLHHVDATFSTYKIESPISQFGLGVLSAGQLSKEVRDVLMLCELVREETSGAFDVACVPAPNGSTLDPSGLVKGWAIERAAELLEAHGAANFCINAGGDIALRGSAEPDQPWRIGIRHPSEPLASAAVLSLGGRAAIATSATYERGAHIIDPKTGQPTAALASVTIVGQDLTYVDAYATAVFVMGLMGAEWLMETHPELDAFVIGHDGLTWETPGFNRWRSS